MPMDSISLCSSNLCMFNIEAVLAWHWASIAILDVRGSSSHPNSTRQHHSGNGCAKTGGYLLGLTNSAHEIVASKHCLPCLMLSVLPVALVPCSPAS